MNNVTLIFSGITDNPCYQAYVNIYDGNKLIYSCYTINGRLSLILKVNRAYRIQARLLTSSLNTSFYVSNNTCELHFNFYSCLSRNIIFTLRDYFYNLPIERGVITLWQNQ